MHLENTITDINHKSFNLYNNWVENISCRKSIEDQISQYFKSHIKAEQQIVVKWLLYMFVNNRDSARIVVQELCHNIINSKNTSAQLIFINFLSDLINLNYEEKEIYFAEVENYINYIISYNDESHKNLGIKIIFKLWNFSDESQQYVIKIINNLFDKVSNNTFSLEELLKFLWKKNFNNSRDFVNNLIKKRMLTDKSYQAYLVAKLLNYIIQFRKKPEQEAFKILSSIATLNPAISNVVAINYLLYIYFKVNKHTAIHLVEQLSNFYHHNIHDLISISLGILIDKIEIYSLEWVNIINLIDKFSLSDNFNMRVTAVCIIRQFYFKYCLTNPKFKFIDDKISYLVNNAKDKNLTDTAVIFLSIINESQITFLSKLSKKYFSQININTDVLSKIIISGFCSKYELGPKLGLKFLNNLYNENDHPDKSIAIISIHLELLFNNNLSPHINKNYFHTALINELKELIQLNNENHLHIVAKLMKDYLKHLRHNDEELINCWMQLSPYYKINFDNKFVDLIINTQLEQGLN